VRPARRVLALSVLAALVAIAAPARAQSVPGPGELVPQAYRDAVLYTAAGSDVDFSVEVSKMKDAGVDFITTCMDTNGVLALAKEARKQGLDAIQYLPNGYDQAFMKANGSFFEGSYVRVPFVPFETSPRPKSLDQYLTWMDKQGDTPTESSTYG